jgi:hypothetical protein
MQAKGEPQAALMRAIHRVPLRIAISAIVGEIVPVPKSLSSATGSLVHTLVFDFQQALQSSYRYFQH